MSEALTTSPDFDARIAELERENRRLRMRLALVMSPMTYWQALCADGKWCPFTLPVMAMITFGYPVRLGDGRPDTH